MGTKFSITSFFCALHLLAFIKQDLKGEALTSALNLKPVSNVLFLSLFCTFSLNSGLLVRTSEILYNYKLIVLKINFQNFVQLIIFQSHWQSLQQPILKQQQGSVY